MKNTVVIVSEDVHTRVIMETLLWTRGLHVLFAKDATEVCDIVCCEGAAVVVLELALPDTHGFEVLRRLRRRFESHTLPTQPAIVVVADWAEPAAERLALRLGADVFLRWPVPTGQFFATIEPLVAAAQPARALEGRIDV